MTPGMTFTFKDSEVEVLEVLQEEKKTAPATQAGKQGQQIPAQILLGGIKMAKKKRKYYSGKELLYRRQLARQQAEAEEKTNNIRVRQLHQINASSRAIGWAKQKMREGKNNDCISD